MFSKYFNVFPEVFTKLFYNLLDTILNKTQLNTAEIAFRLSLSSQRVAFSLSLSLALP